MSQAGPLTLSERRLKLLGPGMRQFYDFPFHPVSGQGVWLVDGQGKRYLDAYNNVPHVGHCNSAVVEALTRQAATLNTNTRYLHETVLDYAERLLATMPQGLDTCMFVCTGTEANDLAWRLARAFTGNDGAIATRHAYHGNSTFVSALDCSTRTTERPNHWLATVPAPPDATASVQGADAYADHFDAAIAALAAHRHRPAAFYMDSLFATDGLELPAPGYLDEALRRLRAAGGLCVADEVQPGLGRTGTAMWGFQNLGIVPDIVTTGKPMGNGHPLAVLVTRREIVDAFFARDRYFNTFGGNPVSAAVGLAVLDVLEREKLRDNARVVGSYLKEGLSALAGRSDAVGAVRGAGLFLGVAIVDTATGQADPMRARKIINDMCHRGVLVGLTGPASNLLKIRPPLVFGRSDADLLIDTLDQVLKVG
ncbi:MAG: aminotransferase class III-fold pyridoxal phosphate-dependent enzyme [Rhizobiaceae bacterium]